MDLAHFSCRDKFYKNHCELISTVIGILLFKELMGGSLITVLEVPKIYLLIDNWRTNILYFVKAECSVAINLSYRNLRGKARTVVPFGAR